MKLLDFEGLKELVKQIKKYFDGELTLNIDPIVLNDVFVDDGEIDYEYLVLFTNKENITVEDNIELKCTDVTVNNETLYL